MKYYELWIVLWKWKKEFLVKEFIANFQSPCPNKTLFDMTKKGFLEKIGWGKYKVISPKELFKKRTNIARAYDLIKGIGLKYSFTDADAVFFWTKGGYQVGRFFGFYPIFLKVLKSDLSKWKKVLKSKNKKFYIKGKPLRGTFFGIFFVLQPEEQFKTEKVDGFSVDALKDTVEFCKKNIYEYEPALAMLDEMYDLKIGVRYVEI